jgi:hypothetical protein
MKRIFLKERKRKESSVLRICSPFCAFPSHFRFIPPHGMQAQKAETANHLKAAIKMVEDRQSEITALQSREKIAVKDLKEAEVSTQRRRRRRRRS